MIKGPDAGWSPESLYGALSMSEGLVLRRRHPQYRGPKVEHRAADQARVSDRQGLARSPGPEKASAIYTGTGGDFASRSSLLRRVEFASAATPTTPRKYLSTSVKKRPEESN